MAGEKGFLFSLFIIENISCHQVDEVSYAEERY